MIEFKQVSYNHPGGTNALDNINLKIKKNSITAIVGNNGAGKTTLVKHINGLLKPSEGEVTIENNSTKKSSVAELSRNVGMVFQNANHQLFADTVKNEILFGLKNFGFDQDYIDERYELMTDLFDLRKYEEISPLKLSGGEKKKVCLASVLAWNPEILILDEPTVGQDELQKNILFEFINTLHSNNKTIIIISHDIEFLWRLQPNIITMSDGRIIEINHPEKIFTDKELMNKVGLISPQIIKIFNGLGIEKDIPINLEDACKRIQGLMEE